ncbi:MAG: class I SAM-dependent methyltransferase [Chlorobi bacterium]|nr:class I SAM-dependent methyltransferase [Chlorobiota bacterium]
MTHEFDGKKYEKASAHQKEWGERLIAEVSLRGTESVLDLGCGDGILTAQIADLVQQGVVLGIDASQGMIDAALSKERKNLTFCKMDINELNFVERFDLQTECEIVPKNRTASLVVRKPVNCCHYEKKQTKIQCGSQDQSGT